MKKKNSQIKKRFLFSSGLALLCASTSLPAFAVNVTITDGWPCNVWLNHPGAVGAVANNARFNVKATPSASVQSSASIHGPVADYLTSIGQSFNSSIANLPLVEPLDFNLASDLFGASFGVDVCIPAINLTRDDVLDWDVTVTSVGALIPPAEGDWFTQTTPKVEMQLLASNCNTAAGTAMSTSTAEKPGSCYIDSVPTAPSDRLNFVGQSLVFKFKNMASREMALRFSFKEQSTALRPHRLDAGVVNIDFIDAPLPPLLIGDLLGKQLFFAPETDLIAWPGCQNFLTSTGMAFDKMNLQGPSSSLDLRWTGEDNDCTKQNGCGDGNVGGKNFTFPVSVYLEDSSLALPGTPPTAKVKNFQGNFNDLSFSGESQYPANGKIEFLTEFDEVYRSSGKAMFSTTVSREVAAGVFRNCRVWFKRDNGFDCSSLPSVRLQNLCNNML